MEVATPVVAVVGGHDHTEPSDEVKQLWQEVAHLTDLVVALTASQSLTVTRCPRTSSPTSKDAMHLSVGTIPSLGKLLNQYACKKMNKGCSPFKCKC